MKKTIHRAATRGYADHGWLRTHHTFSFAGYYDPERIHFGALRVLNDDTVAPGEGFGTHPHDNMEIVSLVLSGALKHGDSMGNMQVLKPGELQVMTAGTGITHSEMNASREEPAKFLQIWVITDAEGHTPRYNQIELAPAKRNEFRLIVAPRRPRRGTRGMDSPDGMVSYARSRRRAGGPVPDESSRQRGLCFRDRRRGRGGRGDARSPRRHGRIGCRRFPDPRFRRCATAGHRGPDDLMCGSQM